MTFASSRINLNPLQAVLLREFRAALINRYFQAFSLLCLLGGLATCIFSEDPSAIAFWIVQITICLVSLFAVLAGVSSAQAERSEWLFIFAQPVARSVYLLGKFVAYLVIFSSVLLLLFLPGFFSGAGKMGLLYGQTLLLATTFLTIGLTIGFFSRDRAQAVIVGACTWLLLLIVVDFVALLAARFELIQRLPDLWVGLLMLSPLDAFRVHALFSLEQVPPEAANRTPLASWWIAHTGFVFTIVSVLWSAALLRLASIRLNRLEL